MALLRTSQKVSVAGVWVMGVGDSKQVWKGRKGLGYETCLGYAQELGTGLFTVESN